jgi:DNA-binding CsgD family transcriptional regulator
MEALRELGFSTPTGAGQSSSCPIKPAEREAVLDAAAVLQLRRADLAAAVAQGSVPGVEVVARGGVGINRWMGRVVHDLQELLSVRPAATVGQLRHSLPNNRIAVAHGMRMLSVFDYFGLTDDGKRLLAEEDSDLYLVSMAPVQMKIFDRKSAVLQGPTIDNDQSVMVVSEPTCLAAAWNYWHRIMEAAYSVAEEQIDSDVTLSGRQRQIMALLASDAHDEAIAAALGVSVRTVRADIAEVMRILGVRSRFAAGLRLHELDRAAG